MSANIREYLIVNYDYGVYRVKLTVYGNTTQGREFILDVPEYTFLSEEPVIDPSITNSTIEESVISDQVMPEVEKKILTSTLVSLIVGINLFILIVGGGLIWWVTRDKKSNLRFKKIHKAPVDENSADKKIGLFAKIFKRKPKVKIIE